MRSDIKAALAGEPWAMSGLLFLDTAVDEEGRPVGERRAPSEVKQGVSMVLRACPYNDPRRGQPMNVSALKQITRHLDAVLDDIAAFRATLGEAHTTWEGMSTTVIDQLARPAHALLRAPDTPIPATAAVGHKLAAGYFGLLRRLLEDEALGAQRPLTLDAFMEQVQLKGALKGASEVCAGPLNLITRSTRAILHGDPTVQARIDPDRVRVATTLCAQIKLGIVWTLLDRAVESAIVQGDWDARGLTPRNHFMRDKRQTRLNALAEETPIALAQVSAALETLMPQELSPTHAAKLTHALTASASSCSAWPQRLQTLHTLLDQNEGAILIRDAPTRTALAAQACAYLTAYLAFADAQWTLERTIRAALGLNPDAPMKFNALLLPTRALTWLEAALGHRLIRAHAPFSELTLKNHRRSVVI